MSTQFGYTMMTEQAGPTQLVDDVVAAESVGFDFAVCSDHYFPWLDAQGHAPYAWSVLGAAAYATERIGLMSYVTCPTTRYHPVVVAQKAATVQLLADGRFALGLGSGENLNEHVAGRGWPSVRTRQDKLAEAIAIIRSLHSGATVTVHGRHFDVDNARLWDLPESGGVPIGAAVSGDWGIAAFGPLADHMIATEPRPELVDSWNLHPRTTRIGDDARAIGQIPICWDRDRDDAIARAHEQFRWFGLGWPVNSELPSPRAFGSATRSVTPDDIAQSVACGPDLDRIVESVSAYWKAGFTDIALVQIGGRNQQQFLNEVAPALLGKLRSAAP